MNEWRPANSAMSLQDEIWRNHFSTTNTWESLQGNFKSGTWHTQLRHFFLRLTNVFSELFFGSQNRNTPKITRISMFLLNVLVRCSCSMSRWAVQRKKWNSTVVVAVCCTHFGAHFDLNFLLPWPYLQGNLIEVILTSRPLGLLKTITIPIPKEVRCRSSVY